jgi:hypothetical protein
MIDEQKQEEAFNLTFIDEGNMTNKKNQNLQIGIFDVMI